MFLIPVLLIIAATTLPTIIWLLFFLREDLHPEPKRLLLYTFLMGALMSLPALAFQIIFQRYIGGNTNVFLFSIIGLAFIEEIFKFFGAYFAVHKNPAFDEPIDAMIYAIAAALGFATVENFFIVSNSIQTSLAASLEIMSLRFMGATLLHTLSSGVAGYYWARGKLAKHTASFIARGLIYATLIHAFFNYLVLRFQESSLIYPSLFLVFTVFILLSDFEKIKIAE